jgi:hypothetical protein
VEAVFAEWYTSSRKEDSYLGDLQSELSVSAVFSPQIAVAFQLMNGRLD